MATGDTLIPNGIIDTFKLDDKAIVVHNIVRSTDSDTNPSSPTWTSSTPTSSLITNSLTLTNEPTGNIVLAFYTSANKPYTQTTPKPVIDVEPKVIASNSHSIYKGALVGNQVSGKIQVGNGTNGYESKVLENENRVYDFDDTQTVTIPNIQVVVYCTGVNTTGTEGTYYLWVGGSGTIDFSTTTMTNANFVNLGAIGQIPTHSTIALDNSDSPASKYFKAIEQGDNGVLAGVYGKEMAYNSSTTSFDGDNELFDQLTNGTKTDLNGQTIRTFHGSIPINAEVR